MPANSSVIPLASQPPHSNQTTGSQEAFGIVPPVVHSPGEEDRSAARVGAFARLRHRVRRTAGSIGRGIAWSLHRAFGLVSLISLLAVVATFPVVQLLSLGYLLEATGRVARTGRLRTGLPGLTLAARLGGWLLGTWLVGWPLRAAAGMWYSSALINGGGGPTRFWYLVMVGTGALTALHLFSVYLRGGRLRHFFWPAPRLAVRRLAGKGVWGEARDSFWQLVMSMHLGRLWRLGWRGFAGAILWLFVPISLLVLASRSPAPVAVLSGLLGGLLLATVVLYLPFLQAQFAMTGLWRDLFAVGRVRARFRRAPIAFWIALLVTLAFALPLYLLKAELVPREAAWLPSLVFVLFILPARLLTGWAIARSERREAMRHWFFRHLARLGMLPLVAIYVLVVYFTQYVSWYGGWSLYEQHAFLVPVPFLGL